MANRVWNQEAGREINTKQNTATSRGRGDIGDRSSNLTKLIGAERVSRRNFKYEGTYYADRRRRRIRQRARNRSKVQRTGVSFYEVVDWEYDERKDCTNLLSEE